jgi:hypothetical protein
MNFSFMLYGAVLMKRNTYKFTKIKLAQYNCIVNIVRRDLILTGSVQSSRRAHSAPRDMLRLFKSLHAMQ